METERSIPLWSRRLAHLRAASTMTQVQVAARADLTPLTVSRLETGRVDPSLSTLLRLCRALRTPIGDLFQPDGAIPLSPEQVEQSIAAYRDRFQPAALEEYSRQIRQHNEELRAAYLAAVDAGALDVRTEP